LSTSGRATPYVARTFGKGRLVVDIFSPPRSGFRTLLDAAEAAQRGEPNAPSA